MAEYETDFGQSRRRHTELVDAEADEQRSPQRIAAEFATTPRGPRSELEFFAKFALALALLSITASVLAVIAVSESLYRLNAWKRYRTSLIWVATSRLVLFATLALL